MSKHQAASLSTEIGSGKSLIINLSKANEHNDAAIKELNYYKEMSKRSLEQIAYAVGVSESVLNLWLRKQYTGNISKINDLVKRFLRIELSKLQSVPTSLEFVLTGTAKKILKVVEATHIDGIISLILGSPGSGKTTAVRQYLYDNSPNVTYLQLNQSYRTPYEWLKKLSGGYSSGTINSMANYIIKKLSGSNSLLILDQVDYLSLTSIDILRSISEESQTGLLLIGLPTFAKKLKGESPELIQLRDRIRVYLKLEKLTEEEIFFILDENWAGLTENQKKLFARYSKGSLRLLSSLVYNCRKYLNQKVNEGFDLEEEDIINAAGNLPLQID
jgi:hypothetical protein